MHEVVILALADEPAGCGDACGRTLADKAADKAADRAADTAGPATRVPVLTCVDALRAGGLTVDVVTACSDADIDTALKAAEASDARLVVAAGSDGELRAVVRRMVRRHSPPPSLRPAELPPGRTVFDLPPLAVLPLQPSVPELVRQLGLPHQAHDVAEAVRAGHTARFDLLRNDGGSVTMHSALLGGVDANGAAGVWRGRVEVDDVVLATGDEPLVACAIGNAGRTEIDGLPLLLGADPADGVIEVAVALPLVRKRLLRAPEVQFEVRRARGRAVSVTPRTAGDLHFVDDGVAGTLSRKRSWWVEPAVWAAYVM